MNFTKKASIHWTRNRKAGRSQLAISIRQRGSGLAKPLISNCSAHGLSVTLPREDYPTLSAPKQRKWKRKMLTLLGIPLDVNSSYLRGAAMAPARIREAFACDASNRWSESGVDLGAAGSFADAGDLRLSNSREKSGEDFAKIQNSVGELLENDRQPVLLGGDHSITHPILKAFATHYTGLTVIHFDAHPDLYDEFEGSRASHACPFARIMEEHLAERLIQIGIRTLNQHQREQAERFAVEIVSMPELPAHGRVKVQGPVYISFDMDVLDPAFGPGISHREPGGMSVREAIAHLHAIEGKIVGADIVEYNPAQDVSGMTATVAAKILKEIVGKMILRR
jgi:arginase